MVSTYLRLAESEGITVGLMGQPDDFRKELGKRIRAARKPLYGSAELIAEKIGVKPKAYLHWETGHSMPTAEQLAKLSDALGVGADELLSGRSEWPFDLFSQRDWMALDEDARNAFEDSIAGAIQRARLRNGTNS